jgi:tetratricopeptide (TPR) repeat protein
VHPHPITALTFSPDSRLVLVGCDDGSARLWDVATRKQLGPPVGQRSLILGVAFRPDGQSFVTVDAAGQARTWPVPAPLAEADLERLALRLEVRTGLHMDTGQAVSLLSAAGWEERRQQLIDLEGSAESAYRSTVSLAWRDEDCARRAEEMGDTYGAIWHLDRLIAQRPGDWLLYARRADALRAAGQVRQAEADYALAREHGTGQQLAYWYEHRAVDARVGRQWTTALWYLDRLLPEAPRNWALHREQADVLAGLGKSAESEVELTRAVDLGADPATVLRLAKIVAGQGKWERAAELLDRVQRELGAAPDVVELHAIARLKAGDLPGYRRVCADAVRSVTAAGLPWYEAYPIAWTCALGPQAVADYGPVLKIAEEAVQQVRPGGKPTMLSLLGAVLCRAGRYRDAVLRLNESRAAGGPGEIQDAPFLALAHQQLGEHEQARNWLRRALAERGDRGLWDNVETDLLCREAESAIGPTAAGTKERE